MVEYTTHPCASQLSDVPLARSPVCGSASMEQVLHRHEGLIHAVIRREGSGSLTYEEALQAGRIGLWRAILNYDPTRPQATRPVGRCLAYLTRPLTLRPAQSRLWTKALSEL